VTSVNTLITVVMIIATSMIINDAPMNDSLPLTPPKVNQPL